MQNQTITVLGGTGYLGSKIVANLVQLGFSVRVAVRHPQKAQFPGLAERWRAVACDITDENSVYDAVAGSMAVVNAVSLYQEKKHQEKKPLTFKAVHVQGAERVARHCRQGGISRLVHVSGLGTSTDSPSEFVRARAQGEEAVKSHFPPANIIRPSVMCTPDDGGFIEALKTVTRLPVAPLFGRGTTRLQPVNAHNVAQATGQLLLRPETTGQLFEFGGSQVYSYREAVQVTLKACHRRRLLLPVPFALWHGLTALLSILPTPPFNPSPTDSNAER